MLLAVLLVACQLRAPFLQFILYANIYKILILASFIHAAVAQGTSAGGGGGGDK
jgi:hypothetical protein